MKKSVYIVAYRGLTSPHRCRLTSFSQLKRISQSDQVFNFMFFLTIKAFVMLVTFLLFQSNIYVVLVCEKGPKNSVHRDIFKTKTLNKKSPDSQLYFTRLKVRRQVFSLTDFTKCLKNVIFPKFLVNTLGYGITFDSADLWNFDNGTAGNVIIFGVDNSSSSHANNRKMNIFVLGESSNFEIMGALVHERKFQ